MQASPNTKLKHDILLYLMLLFVLLKPDIFFYFTENNFPVRKRYNAPIQEST